MPTRAALRSVRGSSCSMRACTYVYVYTYTRAYIRIRTSDITRIIYTRIISGYRYATHHIYPWRRPRVRARARRNAEFYRSQKASVEAYDVARFVVNAYSYTNKKFPLIRMVAYAWRRALLELCLFPLNRETFRNSMSSLVAVEPHNINTPRVIQSRPL